MSASTSVPGSVLLAPSPAEQKYDFKYYLASAASGGICCSITHGALCPVDVVKTRMQLDPVKYNSGLIGGMRQVVAEEGAMALTTGLGATAFGYFVQGWIKFGGVEFFKIQALNVLGEEKAWNNKMAIYLGAAAAAETIADIFLCPLEAVRIRSVSDPNFCDGLADGFGKMLKADGIGGLYAGLFPMFFKQVPYTMAKFAVQGETADSIYASMGKTPSELSSSTNLAVSLGSGVIAGVAAAIISHPADTLLSKINKAGAGGDGPMMTRLMNIAKEVGFVNLCTVGLLPRCVMIGTLTAGQFGLFDTVMPLLGASKFHFHDPNSH
jgi:solute carrier family 25 (mitochondrial phosphate transporter), member 3